MSVVSLVSKKPSRSGWLFELLDRSDYRSDYRMITSDEDREAFSPSV